MEHNLFICGTKGKILQPSQCIKEGKEPLYMMWVGDQYGWVRESSILGIVDSQ